MSLDGLVVRVFDFDLMRHRNSGAGEQGAIAVVLERPPVEEILTALGLAPRPPHGPRRGPSAGSAQGRRTPNRHDAVVKVPGAEQFRG
jgi:hypothetical protein